MPAPAVVKELVERFDAHRETYRSSQYKEAEVRCEFLDPLFEALGWDVFNRKGYADAYKEVIHEDAIKIGGRTKAPDYCFRAGGQRTFFIEAKKPSVDIRDAVSPAYQLRRYAWSAKLPVSILTDFEEFAVYDCRIRPEKTDKAATARVILRTYNEYIDRWDELFELLSPDAIRRGSIERFLGAKKIKKGTAQVDDAFLTEIESWRDVLARNIALRNPGIAQRDLNFAVGKTIDRLVFLRMCEDRGIEPYGRLQDLVNAPNIYPRLAELFQRADERYNSGLFHFNPERDRPEAPDELTLGLSLDDKPLKEIICSLYYPDSPYEFSVLPAEILGQVYEQFLGKVIRLTKGGQAKVEEKPEVRKAGGVYYTPAYIVEYIVQHTVGKLLAGSAAGTARSVVPAALSGQDHASHGAPRTPKTPQQAAKLRILDPACGSGSFLIGAYEHLLNWHRDWYVREDAEKHARGRAPKLFHGPAGDWRLTTAEKKRILLNNIYGVDIDPQAVEVTKLSLLLKVLEGESQETIANQLRLFHERALPDLGGNIKCGNSLIGPDFYNGRQMSLLNEEEQYRINAFGWKSGFPGVLKQLGGFDAVIGNPPWGQKEVGLDDSEISHLRGVYTSLAGIFDMFRPFVERGVSLVSQGGVFGMVLPDIVLLKDYPDTRLFMLRNLALTDIRWWGMAFADAVIDAVTIIGNRGTAPDGHMVHVAVVDTENAIDHEIPQNDFLENPRYTFNLTMTQESRGAIEALQRCPRLGDFFEVHEGVHSGNMRSELFVSSRVDKSCKPLYFGRTEIAPHVLSWNGRYVRLGAIPISKTRKRYANAGQPEWHERSKVLVRRTGDHVISAVDNEGYYASNNFFVVFPKDDCSLDLNGLCALLNSKFVTWYFRTIEPRKGRVFCELKIKHLSVFPLPEAVLSPDGCAALNHLGRQCAAAAERAAAGTPHEREVRERAMRKLEDMIEDCVMSLLGASSELQAMITGNHERR